MIIYSVTVNIDFDIENEWVEWMKNTHIPDVLNTGMFLEHRMSKVLSVQSDETGVTYNIQYTCRSMNDYEKYLNEFADELQKEHSEKYANKFAAFRTLLELV
jgi:hypothetical protein